jgi:leucyl-tRNA synthetase
VACELWEKLGHHTHLDYASWPVLDKSMLVETEFELVLQVNGKIRAKIMAPMNLPQDQALALAKQNLVEHLAGKVLVKEIYVTNKLVNIVVK